MLSANYFGPEAKFHHVGIVVESITDLFPKAEIFEDPIQKVAVAFVEISGAPIELVEPRSEESPVSVSMRKGQKLLHLCFEVPNLNEASKTAREFGFQKIGQPKPATAFKMRKILWVFSRKLGLVELVERGT